MNPESVNPHWLTIYCSAYGVYFVVMLAVHFHFSRKWRRRCEEWRSKDAA